MKQTLHITVTTIEPILGSACANPELHSEFIASKAETETKYKEEMDALQVEKEIEKTTTVFPRNSKGVILWDYQFRGFLKHAIGVLTELGETDLTKWVYKRAVDCLVFVTPRQIQLLRDGQPITGKLETLQRPLRAETMQGDRVAIASSEIIPAGITGDLTIDLLVGDNSKSKLKVSMDDIRAALNYGALVGLGQWRNGSYGRFTWEERKV